MRLLFHTACLISVSTFVACGPREVEEVSYDAIISGVEAGTVQIASPSGVIKLKNASTDPVTGTSGLLTLDAPKKWKIVVTVTDANGEAQGESEINSELGSVIYIHSATERDHIEIWQSKDVPQIY